MNRGRWNVDEQGQVDGDVSSGVPFPPRNVGAGGGLPPWHLWGNTQLLTTTIQDSSLATRTATPGNLVRIGYKRPETWRWLLAAKLVDGPDATAVEQTQVEVAFDLIVGIGRAAVLLQPQGVPTQDKAFEQYFFQWGGGPALLFPRGVQIYTSQVLAPNRVLRTNPPFPNQDGFPVAGAFVTGPSVIDHIVAQDLQLNCRIIALAPPGAPQLGGTVTVEVSGLFSPQTHVRPDWFGDGEPAQQFTGAETGGA